MNIREAMLKAADHIEQQPQSYNFRSVESPACGAPGCMWGWVGHYLGVKKKRAEAYSSSVTEAVGHHWSNIANFGDRHGLDPRRCAADAAKTLRLFADAEFPAEAPKPRGIPDSVRAIFDVKEVA